ncbi:MAG: ACT domain-containing protein, partial [Candidatus Omnitrophica bacterium]|nr:ACT domain-containing protein [Candidatus Omnitrophota bacterium]
MINAILDSQLMIRVDNKVGTLAEVSSVISASQINLLAISASAVDNVGHLYFVTENNAEAKRLLKQKKYDVREEKVVLVTLDNKPGALQGVTTKIAQA